MVNLAAKNLKFIRIRLFLTQEALGSYFQLSRHQINSYEIGRANVPAGLINRLCQLLNLDEQDFLNTDFAVSNTNWQHINKEILDRFAALPEESRVNEWKEKYYNILERYNEALEELRRNKKGTE